MNNNNNNNSSHNLSFREVYGHLFFYWHSVRKYKFIAAINKTLDDMEKAGYDVRRAREKLLKNKLKFTSKNEAIHNEKKQM